MTAPYNSVHTVNEIQASGAQERVLIRIKNERMGGTMPAWVSADKAKTQEKQSFKDELTALSPPTEQETAAINPAAGQNDENYGFADLIDMINPLQHIPLVNIAYRNITGDSIKPFGKIMGGAIFGGPTGAASGVVDAIITKETGKDLAGNAIALIKNDPDPLATSDTLLAQSPLPMNPQAQLIQAAAQNYDRVQFAEERTAGSIIRYA